MKKIISFLLTLSLLLTCVPATVVAEVDEPSTAIEVIQSLGYYQGDENGDLQLDKTITRAEYSVIICRLMDLNAAGVSEFTDVPASHWATGYVNAASQAGVIKGYGDGNFGPEDSVKYEEAVTMLIRALGYEPLTVSKGSWPQSHIKIASAYGLLNEVDGTIGTAIDRESVAIMLYNALDVPVVEQTGFGTNVQYTIMKQTDDQDKVTVLTKLNVYKVDGVIVSDAKVSYGMFATKQEKNYIQIKVTEDYDNPDKNLRLKDNKGGKLDPETDALITLKDENGFTNGLVGTNVTIYFEKTGANRYNVVAAVPVDGASKLVVDASDIVIESSTLDGARPVIKYYKDNSSKLSNIYLEAGYNVIVNNEFSELSEDTLVGNIEFVDWDNDNKYDVVNIVSYVHVIVEEVDTKHGIIDTYNDIRIDLDIDNEDALISIKDINGNTIDYETIEEYDVLAITATPSIDDYESLDIVNLGKNVVIGAVKGTSENISGETTYTINGKKYELDTTDSNYMEVDNLEIGTEGTFFLGIDGKIIGFEGSKAANGKHAFIISAYATRASNATITLLTNEGIKTYSFAEKFRVNDGDRISIKDSASNWFESAEGSLWAALDSKFSEDITELDASSSEARARLIQFNTNSNNEITEIFTTTDDTNNENKNGSEYREDTQKLNSKNIADNITIFNIDWDNLELSTVKDISYLIDESEYAYLLADKNDDNEYQVMVVLDTESAFASATPLAIITSVEEGINDETDADIWTLNVIVNGEEKVITIDEEETKDVDDNDFHFGTVILYNADSSGLVDSYVHIGDVDKETLAFTFADVNESDINIDNETYEEGDAYFYGYYVDKTAKTLEICVESAKAYGYEDILDDGVISLPGYAKAQLYQFSFVGRNPEIEIGSGVTGLTKHDEPEDTIENYVLVRTVDGTIQEVIGFDFDR